MKTAISLPDSLYFAAEKIAQNMGIARSQLYAKALEEFIANHTKVDVTEKLNEVYGNLEDTEEEVLRNGILEIREMTKNDSW